jgi:hypothetical protein
MSDLRAAHMAHSVEGCPWCEAMNTPEPPPPPGPRYALIPEGSVLVTEETLAAALISSDLIRRYAEYAQDAHEWTMQREGHEVLGDQWAAAILARIREEER